MWSDWLVFCDYGFSVSVLWCPLATPTVLPGLLLPWTWGISSQLLQQSTATAPWTWGGSSSWHCTGDRDQDHPHGKGMEKSKMAAWGRLTNSWEKKRSEKQRRKERYKYLNAEFQRIARRDKKAFLRDQCKEIEENNRMGKTRDLFKKIRDTKGTFHAKMGSIKDWNGMDLTEA